MNKNERILFELRKIFDKPKCELVFENNFQLICAVVLSAQCTDKRVNMTTPKLFEKYPTPKDLANAKKEDVIEIIRPCGFFNNKSNSLINLAKALVEKFNSEVPNDYDSLVSLAGVGRKTANVVLAVGFGKDTIAVDTHVFRVSNRLGIKSKNVLECENKLQKIFNKSDWSELHYLLVLFGRYHCKAIKPMCKNCALCDICEYVKTK